MSVTLDEVQHLAAQLSPLDTWAQLESFWQAIEAPGPAAPSATAQLLADRRSRQEGSLNLQAAETVKMCSRQSSGRMGAWAAGRCRRGS